MRRSVTFASCAGNCDPWYPYEAVNVKPSPQSGLLAERRGIERIIIDHATEWTLTMYGVGKVAPTKEFMQWEKKNAVPTVDTDQCQPLTPSAVDGAKQ